MRVQATGEVVTTAEGTNGRVEAIGMPGRVAMVDKIVLPWGELNMPERFRIPQNHRETPTHQLEVQDRAP